MAVVWSGDPQGGEADVENVGTTWLEVRMPLSVQRVTGTSSADWYLQRGVADGGTRTGGSAIAATKPYSTHIGRATDAERTAGYRLIYVASATGNITISLRGEVA